MWNRGRELRGVWWTYFIKEDNIHKISSINVKSLFDQVTVECSLDISQMLEVFGPSEQILVGDL